LEDQAEIEENPYSEEVEEENEGDQPDTDE